MGNQANGGVTYESLRGTISVFGLNLTYDFTDGLTKEQWEELQRRKETGVWVKKGGRVLIPSLNIF